MNYVQIPASISVCLPRGIPPRAYIRWWEANTSVCTPQRTPTSCTRISPSSSTTPVRWEPQSRETLAGKYAAIPLPVCARVPPPQVEVENPDLRRFPDFAEAPYLDCVLRPGDVLFIPVQHWHYVRSLELSFSVSFWWS